MPRIPRETIVQALEAWVADEPKVLAAWEGGSASFGRADGFSDIDWVLLVEAADVDAMFPAVEKVLEQLSPIEASYTLPHPTWHGHAQTFYRLRDAAADHFVDLVVMHREAKDFFLQPELHGTPRMVCERIPVPRPPPLEGDKISAENRARIAAITERHRVIGVLPGKEVRRGRPLDALAFYQSITLRHLVELLRIAHDPHRPGFGLRYLEIDLPVAVRERLEPLLFVGGREQLARAVEQADAWIEELLGEGVGGR